MFAFRWLGLLALVSVTACGSRRTVVVTPKPARLVEIEVEVYDPVSNGVWEGVSVRVVEGYHEWSNCTCEAGNPFWLVTDETGRVLFTAEDLADADIGFLEDSSRRAILESDRDLDEAFVLIEIDAVGFDRVFVDVPVSWVQPSVLVSVPFSASGSGGIAAAPGTAGVRLIPPTAEQAPRTGLAISARAAAATVQ